MFLMCANCQHPVYVAREHVNFDIELLPRAQFAKRRVLGRMRNDIHCKMGVAVLRVAYFVDGQRYAVEGDRTFRRDHWRELFWNADPDARRVALWTSADKLGDCVDVAGDDVAAQLVTEA